MIEMLVAFMIYEGLRHWSLGGAQGIYSTGVRMNSVYISVRITKLVKLCSECCLILSVDAASVHPRFVEQTISLALGFFFLMYWMGLLV